MSFAGLLLPLLAAQAIPPRKPPQPPPPPPLQVSSAVVRISNGLGHGTGFVIDEAGFIVTNVHVAASPIPYAVEVETERPGLPGAPGPARLRFQKVLLAGVHPRDDLALIKIDPAEHRVALKKLKLRKEPASLGEQVKAIGYPGDIKAGQQLLTTDGRVAAPRRILYRREFIDTDVSIWFGNSGGPLVDARGDVIGVISLKQSPTDTALAVPAAEIRPQFFVPIRSRPPDPTLALDLQHMADKAFGEFKKSRDFRLLHLGVQFLTEAVTIDLGNEEPLVRVGAILLLENRNREAAAFLTRLLQINGWPRHGASVYAALSLALSRLQRPNQGVLVAEEGIAKYPEDSGILCQALSEAHRAGGNPPMAAAAAALAREKGALPDSGDPRSGDRRAPPVAPADARAVEIQRRALESRLEEASKTAPAARAAKKPFLTPAFEKFLKTYDGVQHEGSTDGVDLGRGASVAPDAASYADDAVTAMFVQGQLAVGKEHLKAGRRDLGIQTLRSLVANYPARPEAKEAEVLLDLLEKK